MKRKIAFFLPNLGGGGAEKVMLNLAKVFAEDGFFIDMVLSKAEGPLLKKVPDNVRIIDLNSKSVSFSLPRLVSYLKMHQPSALLSALDHANVVAILAKSLSKMPVKIIASVHTTITMSVKNSSYWRGKLLPMFVKLCYPKADAIVVVSKKAAEDLLSVVKLKESQLKVIYNPVIDEDIFKLSEEPVEHPWFKEEHIPVILGVGRLGREKDFSTLIKAFKIVRETIPSRLMILGEGEERPNLEALIRKLDLQEWVKMPGFVENPYKYMKKASLFVLSSRWEGLSLVLIEAIALGVPVVSTNCPSGPSEILQGHEDLLVPVGDEQALARKMVEVLTKPWNRRIPTEQYTVKYAAERYLEVLEA